jgi:YHS domain-containing protein
MLRVLLFMLLAFYISRAVWRLLGGIVEGASGGGPRGRSRGGSHARNQAPERGVSMVRDPVCGTFVLPGSSVALTDGRTRVYFCSDDCRDKYRARTA